MNVPGLNDKDIRRTIQAVRDLAAGGSNAIGPNITLAAGATETVVEDRGCGPRTLPMLAPHTAAAASVSWWIAGVEKGRFVLGHDPAPAGAVFRYELRQP